MESVRLFLLIGGIGVPLALMIAIWPASETTEDGLPTSGAVLTAVPPGGASTFHGPKDVGNFQARYVVATAPVISRAIQKFLTVEEIDSLRQFIGTTYYERFVTYSGASLPPDSSGGILTEYTMTVQDEDDNDQVRGLLRLQWDPLGRVVPVGFRGNAVSTALVPVPAPESIGYVTGRVSNGSSETVTMRRRPNSKYVMPSRDLGYLECWEYEAAELPGKTRARLRIWIEKTSGVVGGGFGDLGDPNMERVSWALMYTSANPSRETSEGKRR